MTDDRFGGYDGGVVDTLIGLPTDHRQLYETMRRTALRDAGSQDMVMPAAYMFHDVPQPGEDEVTDPVAATLTEMDRFGIEVGSSASPPSPTRPSAPSPIIPIASWRPSPSIPTG